MMLKVLDPRQLGPRVGDLRECEYSSSDLSAEEPKLTSARCSMIFDSTGFNNDVYVAINNNLGIGEHLVVIPSKV